MKIASRVQKINPSITLALNARALDLTKAGVDLIKLGVGEPDIDTPDIVCDAGIQAINDRKLRYTPTAGLMELRKAIVGYMESQYGVSLEINQVMASSGAKHVLYNAITAMVDPGDEVLIPTPYWVSYPEMVCVNGGIPVFVETTMEEDFKLTPEKLEQAITPKTTVLFLNSPSNPTGGVYTREELEALADVLKRYNIWVLSDDIYSNIVFGRFPFTSMYQIPGMEDRTLVVNGLSKTFSMTGWRLGYGVGPKDLIASMTRLQDHSTSCPSSVSQIAGAKALTEGPKLTADWIKSLQTRRDLMLKLLLDIPGIKCSCPKGAFYLFADFREYLGPKTGIKDTMALGEHLINEARVVAVPGEAFGAPGFLRLSFGVNEDTIREGIKRISEAMAALKA
jgi:aspartate aminotransferase